MTVIDLSTPEGKAALAAEIEKATGPLLEKRDELLGEVKKLRKGQQIDPADMERIEAERDQYKQQATEAQKLAKKAAADAEAATKKATDLEGSFNNTLRDAQLTEALTKAGVTNPVHLKYAKAELASKLQVVTEGDARVVKAGDKELGSYITEWAGSDEGKHFVAAPDASGGGAHNGGHNPAPSSTLTSTQKIAAGLAKL